MRPTGRNHHEFRRFSVAILASLVVHILVAFLVIWYLNRAEEEDEPEKVPITPFEVAVIEEREEEAGKDFAPAMVDTNLPMPPLEAAADAAQPPQPTEEVPEQPKPQPKKPKPSKPQSKPTPAPETSSDSAAEVETDSTSKTPKRSTVFLPQKEKTPDFRFSGEVYNETIGYKENKKLTQKLRGQKRFVGLADQMQMAKVTLANVTGGTIRPGNHHAQTSETAQEFLHRLHNYIHRRWAMQYIPMLNQTGNNTDKINDLELNAEIELVLDGATGEPVEVVIARSSGVGPYDTEAVMVTKNSATTGPVPRELWSDNGKVYIHWNYWRDQRQCGIFGANVYILDSSKRRRRTVTGVQ